MDKPPKKLHVGLALLGASLVVAIPVSIDLQHRNTVPEHTPAVTKRTLEGVILSAELKEEINKESEYTLNVEADNQTYTVHVQSSMVASNKALSQILEPGITILMGPIIVPSVSGEIYVPAHNIAPVNNAATETKTENNEERSIPKYGWWQPEYAG